MFLPKKRLQSAQGQILVLFLLILVLGLAVVLSVSSRVITDIRVTTTTDESNRAYFAAEAGIEEALRKLRDDPFSPVSSFQLDFTNLNDTDSDTEVEVALTVSSFVYPANLVRDEVVQVNLLGDPKSLSIPVGFSPPTQVDIHWGTTGDVNPPALEVTLLHCKKSPVESDSCNVSNPKIEIKKFVFAPGGGGNFCHNDSLGNPIASSPHDITDTMTGQSRGFFYVATLGLAGGVSAGNCGGTNLPGMGPNNIPIFLRLRPIMDPSGLQPGVSVAVVSRAGGPLPAQGAVITSTGKTISGVTRKIKVIRLFPALPALFDYVLFSGGSGPIRK